jgi:hypothetical protein
MSTITILLLGMHIIGDFYLQPTLLAEYKKKKFTGVLIHSIVYAMAFLPLLMETESSAYFIIVGLHFLFDSIKFPIEKRATKTEWLFVIDQILHVATLYWVSQIYMGTALLFTTNAQYIRLAVYLLILLKPTSIMFQMVFSRFKPQGSISSIEGAGKTIGYLERLVLAALVLMGQPAAIGWVIAAKAFARSKQLSESADFCEYFLVGTLVSIISVLAWYTILITWI